MNRELLYEKMKLIRLFESKIEELFSKGDLFGTTHACIGQEAVAVGVISALDKDDIITSNHRGHGHFIAYCDDVEGLMAELMGKQAGVCGGRSGSQHLNTRNFYSNGITGGMTAVATGMAYAEKIKKSGNIVVAFFGDGALGEGVLYESMNIASLWGLPILYVLENNYYAMSTPINMGVAGDITARPSAFGIDNIVINAEDAEKVFNESKSIIRRIRENHRPYFMIINTYRFCGHSKSDERDYRTREEEEEWENKDPLIKAGSNLSYEIKHKIDDKCNKRINEAVDNAQNCAFPDPEGIYKGIYQ